MAVSKEYLVAVSQDATLRAEAENAAFEALVDFLKERGLEEEAGKAIEAATEKFAEAHGFKPEYSGSLDLDELDAVAGGGCFCPGVGGGTGTGKQCGCGIYGKGTNDSGEECPCYLGGYGCDD